MVGRSTILKTGRLNLDNCIENSQGHLLGRQHPDGYWVGLLEADVSVVSGFIPLIRIFGIRNAQREKKAYNYFVKRQNGNGSWSLYYGGEGSLDVTVQTYFCLKMIGVLSETEIMTKAKSFILDRGGIEKTNTYTKIILALFGQYPWSALPIIPPEIIYLPRWSYINIYDFASWTRATILAFSIILTLRPVFETKKEENIFELYRDTGKAKTGVPYKAKRLNSLENIFIALNSAINIFERLPGLLKFSRKSALKKVEEWILSHQEDDGSWGGIMLPWLFSLIALKCLGYKASDPIIVKGLGGLEDFMDEDSESLFLQPATSPVWDTAWTMLALVVSGFDADHPALQKGAEWLLKKQVNIYGDWKIKNPKTRPGCWSFEFENQNYPDIDDTAIVCCALNSVKTVDEKEKIKAIKSGLSWVTEMQNHDGSWAAFDRDNCKKLLKFIPFADFITPLDFGSPDITAHVLYTFGRLQPTNDLVETGLIKNKIIDFGSINAKIKKAVDYLISSQEIDGSWYGRWGVNYIYGTSKVLQAYEYLKKDFYNARFTRAVLNGKNWLESIVNADGGWGESCKSYENSRYEGLGRSTASQTAWAVLGLLSLDAGSGIARRGIDFLIRTQRPDGSWDEDFYTGGGFPGAFYLKYELYKDYFPLLALAKYRETGKHLKENKRI